MKRQVRILRRALADMEEIRRYVARDRPLVATQLISRLLNVADSLSEHPNRGARPRDNRLRDLGFRVVVVSSYLLFYKVGPRVVRVYRVVHAHRRYEGIV